MTHEHIIKREGGSRVRITVTATFSKWDWCVHIREKGKRTWSKLENVAEVVTPEELYVAQLALWFKSKPEMPAQSSEVSNG